MAVVEEHVSFLISMSGNAIIIINNNNNNNNNNIIIIIIIIIIILDLCDGTYPAVLCDKNFNAGHYSKTFKPNFFVPAMLIGTIDFCHFMPLSLTLNLLESHKDSTKQNFLASFSCTHFK